MKVLENNAKIAEIEARLNKYGYLSKATLPGYADGRVFLTLETIKRTSNQTQATPIAASTPIFTIGTSS